MSPCPRLTALFIISALSACGGKSFDAGEPPNGGTDAGGTSAGGTSAGGTSVGGAGSVAGTAWGGSAIGGTGVGGGDAECSALDDEPPIEVLVEVRNETSHAIHLGPQTSTCDLAPLFSVADAAGTALPALGWCRFSCQSFRDYGGAGCITSCPITETISLPAGESLFTTWDGLYRADRFLPARCVLNGEPEQQLTCDQAKVIRPGAFTFSAQAGTGLECSLSSMCPSCQPDANGGCRTSGTLVTGKLLQAVTKVELVPRYGALRLPTPPGAAPEPLPPLTVTLVFTE
ncbi:MAG: hypothetical protein K0R38_4502 [Polyangiaceae bacterium]|nr:hypothetical protein [Polyangiaceae bacterium]